MKKLIVTADGGRLVDLTPEEVSELSSQQAKWAAETRSEPVTVDKRIAAIEKRLEALEGGKKEQA